MTTFCERWLGTHLPVPGTDTPPSTRYQNSGSTRTCRQGPCYEKTTFNHEVL